MIDTHAHLYMFDKNGEEIIKNMKVDNLQSIITIGTTTEDSKINIEIAEKNDNIYATVGIYPEYSLETSDEELNTIYELAKNEKVVAIGEIGLDYHSENYDKESQKRILIKQLEIADKLGIPFCIHCRNAYEDLYNILNDNKHLINHFGVMHCYSGGEVWYKKFLDLGLYLSFSGNITYKKNPRYFLRNVPLDRFLIETDSPFLSPEPMRGKQNEPKNVRYVLDKIAIEIGTNPTELEKITNDNAKRLFYKMK